MLLSMTGQGEARASSDDAEIVVEVRTVNSRYLKISVRANDGFSYLESRVEEQVRQSIRRGAVQVNLRCTLIGAADYQLNLDCLRGYRRQLESLAAETGQQENLSWSELLNLPGVVEEPRQERDTEEFWGAVRPVVIQALGRLDEMRRREGEAMYRDLHTNLDAIAEHLQAVVARAPAVVENYQRRIVERLNALLEEQGVELEPSDVVREVGIYSERCDISEEVVRLASHVEQYRLILDDSQSNGRKLDFLTQELHREANTIGSKANDATLSQHVVEMKTLIERMREMIQNVE